MRNRFASLFAIGALAGTISCSSPSQDGETPTADAEQGARSGDESASTVVDSVAVMAQELGVELVARDFVSTNRNETFPAEDPVDGSLWFSVYDNGFDAQTIYVSPRTTNGWDTPRIAPFSGSHGDRAPRFSPSGDFLYFTSNRPREVGGSSTDMNIWRVERTGTSWSSPELMAEPLNSDASDIHVAATQSAVWVASNRDGSFGRADIYRVVMNGEAIGAATHLPAPINDEHSQPDIWVSPDESWLVLVITDHADGYGGDDLYISRLVDGAWTEPRNLGPGINSDEYEYGPTMSRDGQYIYFTSHRAGSADVYRVPVGSVLRDIS